MNDFLSIAFSSNLLKLLPLLLSFPIQNRDFPFLFRDRNPPFFFGLMSGGADLAPYRCCSSLSDSSPSNSDNPDNSEK